MEHIELLLAVRMTHVRILVQTIFLVWCCMYRFGLTRKVPVTFSTKALVFISEYFFVRSERYLWNYSFHLASFSRKLQPLIPAYFTTAWSQNFVTEQSGLHIWLGTKFCIDSCWGEQKSMHPGTESTLLWNHLSIMSVSLGHISSQSLKSVTIKWNNAIFQAFKSPMVTTAVGRGWLSSVCRCANVANSLNCYQATI